MTDRTNPAELAQTLRDEAQHLLDRGAITRGQRIVVASAMRSAADFLDAVYCDPEPYVEEPWVPDHLPSKPGDQLAAAVFQALGSASMCWDNVGGAGVFLSDQAKWVGDGLLAWMNDNGWHHG